MSMLTPNKDCYREIAKAFSLKDSDLGNKSSI